MDFSLNSSNNEEKQQCKICQQKYEKFDAKKFSNNLDISICLVCWSGQSLKGTENLFIRPEIDKITEKIFLGNKEGAKRKVVLKLLNVTHILVVGAELILYHPDDFIYNQISVKDDDFEDLQKYFEETYTYIEQAKGNVFIHCVAGMSRSPTLTIAYLMKKNNMSYEEAFNFVKSKRIFINPKEGFVNQLMKYEKYLKN